MSQLVDHRGRPLHSAVYRKAAPPKIGEQFAPGWASLGKPSYQMPGGGMLLFDLDRLTLQDYRAMRNHYQINISLSLLSFMIHQVNWRIEGTDTKVRTFVEENMREVWGRFIRATASAYWAGYAPVIIQYENDGPNDRIKVTKFKDIEPENASINWKQVDGFAKPGRTKPKINVFDGIKLWPQFVDPFHSVGGHQDAVPPENCVHPDSQILCADLTWRRAGDLTVGDKLVAFDEEDTHAAGGRGGRRYVESTVEATKTANQPTLVVETDLGGPITVTTGHPFLVRRRRNSLGHRRDPATGRMLKAPEGTILTDHWAWVEASDLRPGDEIGFFGRAWETDCSRGGGWLAGMYDGEGSISRSQAQISQKTGPVLDWIKAGLTDRGFQFSAFDNHRDDVVQLNQTGGLPELMRLVGELRPIRLLPKVQELWQGRWLKINKSVQLARVSSVVAAGEQPICSLQTSSRTYIANGYLSHNCFWYPLLMEAGDHYGRKLLKPAFPSWFFSQIIHLYVNRYFERFGEPIPVGRAPFDAEIDQGDGSTISGKQAMENVLEGIRNRAIVTLPADRTNNPQGGKTDWEFSIEYLEGQMRGADFERYLQRLDEEMSLGIFCVTPDTPILCSDMTWRPAGVLQVGDEVVGFDEDRAEDPGLGGASRRFRNGLVKHASRAMKDCSRITTDIGDPVVATADHPWLVWRTKAIPFEVKTGPQVDHVQNIDGFVWVKTEDLVVGDKIAHYGHSWEPEDSRDAGWLAGMYDGEGSLEYNAKFRSWRVSIAQNEGPILEKVKRLLTERGFDFSVTKNDKRNPNNRCWQIRLRGGRREVIRFLGTIRPERLLNQMGTAGFEEAALNRRSMVDLAAVQDVTPVGEQEIASIETSVGTYIADGYLCHNTPVLLYRTADVGSYNLGEAHMQIFLIMVNSLVDDLADHINRFIIRRLIDFNFGPNAGRDVRFVPKKMGEATQATLRQIALGMIQGELATVDVEDLGLALGMKITEVRQVTGAEDDPGDPSEEDDPTPPGTGGDSEDTPADQAA